MAARRVFWTPLPVEGLATAVFLFSFSGAHKPERGAGANRLRLAVLAPKIPAIAVGDVLERLEGTLHYLHKRDNRCFFSTELNLPRAIAEMAETIDAISIGEEIERILERRAGMKSPIKAREIRPASSEKVADWGDGHVLVVLSPDWPYEKPQTTDVVQTMFFRAGNSFRVFPRALIVLAPAAEALVALRNTVRRVLALRRVQKDRVDELSAHDRNRLSQDLQAEKRWKNDRANMAAPSAVARRSGSGVDHHCSPCASRFDLVRDGGRALEEPGTDQRNTCP